jgi:hypothetical protein
VLKRDGTNVVTDSSCAATSGSWTCTSSFSFIYFSSLSLIVCKTAPYDGAKWTAASDLDIDHIVPLKEAWVSGARSWTTARREALANDLTRPQLLAVTVRRLYDLAYPSILI